MIKKLIKIILFHQSNTHSEFHVEFQTSWAVEYDFRTEFAIVKFGAVCFMGQKGGQITVYFGTCLQIPGQLRGERCGDAERQNKCFWKVERFMKNPNGKNQFD